MKGLHTQCMGINGMIVLCADFLSVQERKFTCHFSVSCAIRSFSIGEKNNTILSSTAVIML